MSNNTPFGPALQSGRIQSIDVFRALTVLVMITVNEWHGVAGLPDWMKHMPADADAMSFVDMVFPAFLFIVGMSIPFALQQRLSKGDSVWQVQGHVWMRALGLVVIGVFMVNAEDGYHQPSMVMHIAAWALLTYVAAFLVWGSVRGGPALGLTLRLIGVALFVALAALYRGGPQGQGGMTPQWWGILGLIGWAYLIGCLSFTLSRGRITGLLIALAGCVAYYIAHKSAVVEANPLLSTLFSQDGHFSHASLVLSGCITALLFFGGSAERSVSHRFLWAVAFALVLALLATLLRPDYKISKIYATPSWCLYSAAACVLIYAALYAWVDLQGRSLWPRLLDPVAANPLVAYLIPFVVGALLSWAQVLPPEPLRSGLPGVLYGVAYALLVAWAVGRLAAKGVRLRI